MKSLKKYESIIDEISDERGNGDGIWVYLKHEWADFNFDPYHPTRQIHEWSVRDILSRINSGVRKITEQEFSKYPHLKY
jgi:SPX domain protein involved in polyphosphate accumulation